MSLDFTADRPQVAFARFVRSAVDAARDRHGWTVGHLAAECGLGRSTIFRWLGGEWDDYPELAKVRAFCKTAGLPVGAALEALGMAVPAEADAA